MLHASANFVLRAVCLTGLLAFMSFGLAVAQAPGDSVRIQGQVTDALSGSPLVGASILVVESGTGASTALDGTYSISLPKAGSYRLRVSYVGYAPRVETVTLSQNLTLDVALSEGVALTEVEVRADDAAARMRSTQMSLERVDARQAKLLPALLGEADILKTITLKPGIPSGSEGSSGLYVRGGGTDQNLILLDGATVYNPNHLFGLFSTFNADAVDELRLFKGGFPARYGGRLSSVIDVTSRPGDKTGFHGSGGLGLISSRLTLEGPLGKDRNASWLVSGRRTYVDLITNAINRAQEDNEEFNPIPAYNFYDLNARVDIPLGERDQLQLTGYFGRDQFGFDNDNFDFGFDWGNATAGIQWRHQYNERLFSTTQLSFSDYLYEVRNEIPGFSFEVGSAIRDFRLQHDYTWSANDRHLLGFGVSLTRHRFSVGRLQAGSDDGEVSFSAGNRFAGTELGAYFSDQWQVSPRVGLEAGARLSGFLNGPATYVRLEPRLAANFQATPRVNLKASYARMAQYVHLVASAGVALPTDLWYPSTERVRPQTSDQVAGGLSMLLGKHLLASGEVFYKRLSNQVDFVDGAELFVNNELELDFDFGRGYAYGLELQVERTLGKLRGWVGYTYQRTRRGDFPNIMQGRYFSPRYDRRHDVSVVAFYELNRRWTLTATWVYGSGDLYWLPVGRKLEQGNPGGDVKSIIPVYGDRNNYRLIPFHRADVGAVWKFFPKWGESDLTLSVFNAYDRRNAFFVYIDVEYQDVVDGTDTFDIPERIVPKQVSLFPVLPSITYNFKF